MLQIDNVLEFISLLSNLLFPQQISLLVPGEIPATSQVRGPKPEVMAATRQWDKPQSSRREFSGDLPREREGERGE